MMLKQDLTYQKKCVSIVMEAIILLSHDAFDLDISFAMRNQEK
jgi:hypothetical protein